MILYLDTSALVPLLVTEVSSRICGELWDAADRVVTIRLTHVEAAAALAMAGRLGRLDARRHDEALTRLGWLWRQVDVVEIDEPLMRAASDAARDHALRGYDAVHHAAALAVEDDNLVAAAGDTRLLGSWSAVGLAIANTGADGAISTPG